MPTINIDDICKPLDITVGGKTYQVEDISRETALRMAKLDEKGKDNISESAALLAEILHADPKEIAKLGMRKLFLTIKYVMEAVNEEIEGKNAQKAVAAK